MIAARYIGARLVIPMHYNTFPAIQQNLDEFKKTIERTTPILVALLSPGESIEVNPE